MRSKLSDAKIVFWDFDGVIKDSLDTKADIFIDLFAADNPKLQSKIRRHHLENGGVPRAIKIPLYLKWNGVPEPYSCIERWNRAFSTLAVDKVCASPWVPGVLDYLELNYRKKVFIIVSATPNWELNNIVEKLGLNKYFQLVCGGPTSKLSLIQNGLAKYEMGAQDAVMLGDSETDLEAANIAGIAFGLRRTPFNKSLKLVNKKFEFENFYDI